MIFKAGMYHKMKMKAIRAEHNHKHDDHVTADDDCVIGYVNKPDSTVRNGDRSADKIGDKNQSSNKNGDVCPKSDDVVHERDAGRTVENVDSNSNDVSKRCASVARCTNEVDRRTGTLNRTKQNRTEQN